MTKKEFKEHCSFHCYTGGGEKHNAIFFDWKDTDNGRGFSFGVAASTEFMTRAVLFNELYDWVTHEIVPQYCVRYKYAENDAKRFKTPLSLNF